MLFNRMFGKHKGFFIILLSFLVILSLFIIFNLPKTSKQPDAGGQPLGCTPTDMTGAVDFSATVAYFEGKQITLPNYAFAKDDFSVLGDTNQDKWIEVDLSEQKLKAWAGDKLFLETLVSTGLPWFPTPTGEFHIWIKLRATRMEGGEGRYYYNLPNVPYVMFFSNDVVPSWKGYGLHGTYWHNDFGRVHSHGCVNLPTDIAKELYYWTTPVMPDGSTVVKATGDNPGTRIIIHE